MILNETFERGGIREAGVSYPGPAATGRSATTTFRADGGDQRPNASPCRIAASRNASQGAAITWDMFPILGVQPILGRHLRAEDDRPGAEPVVMLSHEVWQRRYQGDPNIIGRSITVNGRPHTVVGVMPVGFSFPENQKIWIPLGPIGGNGTRGRRATCSRSAG